MIDAQLCRETAATARAARERLAAALAIGDPIEALLSVGPYEGAQITALIRAETHFAQAAAHLDRAARYAAAFEPLLIAEPIAPVARA